MSGLAGRRIVVGVSGGIAAYKAAELVRLLVKAEATVQVVMTRGAEQFITRLTLQTLSGRPALAELFDLVAESKIGHIKIADEAELLICAPATAHLLAKLANGLADDLLSTVALATQAPLLLAPAMNVNMWNHPATRANLAALVARGAQVVGPEAGELACGWQGQGRLVDPAAIVVAAERALARRDLDGVKLLVTAGPTHEPLDPVRFLGNRSSGKMGFALARRAAERGATVVLVAGPVELATPRGVERVDVTTAREMHAQVMARADEQDVVIKAAAVADYRPAVYSETKIKKSERDEMEIALEKNPDILAELGARRRAAGRPLLVGFAAETAELERYALDKLERKGCDLLVANDVARGVFGSDDNTVVLFARSGDPERLPTMSKDAVADRVLDRVRALLPA